MTETICAGLCRIYLLMRGSKTLALSVVNFVIALSFCLQTRRLKQESFEKCWAHSPQRVAARRITIHQVSLLSRRTPPAHRCPRRRRRRRRRQQQRVTEETAMAHGMGPISCRGRFTGVHGSLGTPAI